MRISLLLPACLLAFNYASSQIPQEEFLCGANEQPALLERIAADPTVLQHAIQANQQLNAHTRDFDGAAARNMYTIPVVFHIIHYNGTENISDAQIADAVRILNEDFNGLNPATPTVRPEFQDRVADVGIHFELARRDPDGNCTNGVTRTVSQLTYSGDFEMTQLIQWPRNRYLNVWVGQAANGAAGYTYYPMWLDDWPEADGIVVLHNYLGSIGTGAEYRSHVLTHEVGHWLNLMHCWGNSNEPGAQSNCDMDDGVEDTPLTRGWTSCSLSGASCGSELDNVENYMEYSYCYKMFSEGQADRMIAALTSPIAQRNQLWTSSTLADAGLEEEPVLCEARFMHGRTELCAGGSVQFTDMSYHSVSSRTWSFPGGTPSNSNEEAPLVSYNEAGIYSVTLEVTDGTDTLSRIETDLIRVYADPGMPVPFFEGFEDIAALPEGGWWTKNVDGDNTFMVTDAVSYSGERSIMLQNGAGMMDRIDELRSPSLDLEGASGLAISFRYAFAKRQANNDDRLRVHLSVDCGVNWSVRKQLRGTTNLATAGVVTGSFAPQGESDWDISIIDVPISTFHISDLLMRFEFLSDGGNNLYIDDINIHGTPVGLNETRPKDLSEIVLVPNPANDQSELLWTSLEKAPTRVTLRDVMGRELTTVLDRILIPGEQRVPIPVASLLPGVYLVEVQQGRTRQILRLIKE